MAERVGFDEEQSDEVPEREARRQPSLKITRSAPQSEVKAKSKKTAGNFICRCRFFYFAGIFMRGDKNGGESGI